VNCKTFTRIDRGREEPRAKVFPDDCRKSSFVRDGVEQVALPWPMRSVSMDVGPRRIRGAAGFVAEVGRRPSPVSRETVKP